MVGYASIADDIARSFFGGGKDKGRKPLRKPLSRTKRDDVWVHYLGHRRSAKCYCCGERTIYFDDFHVGHNRPVSKGGSNRLSNLRPICSHCNMAIGTKTIELWRRWHGRGLGGKPKSRERKRKGKSNQSTDYGRRVRDLIGI